jgi:hypothetical protein
MTNAPETMHALTCVATTPNMRVVMMTFLLLQGNNEVKSKREESREIMHTRRSTSK